MKLDEAKILIGDDSILARKQLKDIIAQYGGTTFVEAANGQEAIDKFKSDKPDIVFLDIVMPVKDGIAAVKEIRESQLKNAIEAGAKDFIQKPLNVEQIERVLKNYFEGR